MYLVYFIIISDILSIADIRNTVNLKIRDCFKFLNARPLLAAIFDPILRFSKKTDSLSFVKPYYFSSILGNTLHFHPRFLDENLRSMHSYFSFFWLQSQVQHGVLVSSRYKKISDGMLGICEIEVDWFRSQPIHHFRNCTKNAFPIDIRKKQDFETRCCNPWTSTKLAKSS